MESNEQQGIGQELKISQKDWMEQLISIGPVQTKKWSSSKGGPAFSKLFRLDRADPFSFRPKFLENFGWRDRAQGWPAWLM